VAEAEVVFDGGKEACMKLKQTLASLAVSAMLLLPIAAFARHTASNNNQRRSKAQSSEQIQMVPNGGGDLTYMAQTAPGVIMNTQAGVGNFSTFGLPANSNGFTINGMPENDPFMGVSKTGATNMLLGQNDIREVTVVTNAYSSSTPRPVKHGRAH
jgi:hypothetical protein